MEEKEPRADAKLKNLTEEEQESLWSYLQEKTGDGKRRPLTDLLSEVPLRHGFTTSAPSLSEWRSWYGLKRRMDRAKKRADQARLEYASQHPDLDPSELEKIGQLVFTAESIENGNIKAYVQLMALRLEAAKVAQGSEKIRLAEEALAQAERKLALLEGKVKAAEKAVSDLRNPDIANDATLRQRVLDEVDRAMGIRH